MPSLSDLHHAIRAKEADRALEVARGLNHVPLRYAARLVALLAHGHHPMYERAARRFLIRALEELQDVELVEIKKLADVLAHVHHYYWQHVAQMALHDVVGQLHSRHRRLSVGFDSTEPLDRKRLRR